MFSVKTAVLAVAATLFAVGAQAGEATWYTPNGGYGACGAPSQNSDFVVALSPSEYAGGANCWRHLGVVWQGEYIDVTVVDECPGCEPGHIDLSEGAFQALASLDVGVLQGVDYYYE